MRKVVLFMMMSLDGYIEGPNHDISWHKVDDEFDAYAATSVMDSGTLLFGRRTYELMESYWPTAESTGDDEKVKNQMNTLPKIVFSKTLKKVEERENWKNVELRHEIDVDEIKKLKSQDGKNLTVLGSNNLCVSLIEKGLLDEVRVMINPVVIGEGTPLFHGIKEKVNLTFLETRTFKNGNVLHYYKVTT